jgi:transcription antitermination factor NusG
VTDWGVIISQPQRHKVAVQSLVADGFEYFLPLREICHVSHGRHVCKRFPLFGRYVFVSIIDCWQRLLSMHGVSGMLLTLDLEPALVNLNQLELIRKECNEYSVRREAPNRSPTGLVRGQEVKPTSGAFMGMPGIYDGLVNKNYEAAIFDMFGGKQRIVVRRGVLVPDIKS